MNTFLSNFGMVAYALISAVAGFQTVRSWQALLQQNNTLLILIAAMATTAFILTLLGIIGVLGWQLYQFRYSVNQVASVMFGQHEHRASLHGIHTHAKLHDVLVNHFNRPEIDQLIFELDVPDEWSAQIELGVLARELIMFMFRHGRMDELYAAVRVARPLVEV